MPIDFQETEATPAGIDFQPAIDFPEEESAQDTSQMTPEARESLARAERTADLMMARKKVQRVTSLEEPITDLESLVKGVASPIQSAGMVLNTAGNFAKAAALDAGLTPGARASGDAHLAEVAKSFGQRPPTIDPAAQMGPAEQGLYDAAGMVPMVAAAAGLEALGIPAPVAMGGTMGATAYAGSQGDESTRRTAGLKGAATGMVLPALGQMGKLAVAKTLSAAAERGLISGNATLAQKALESVGSQALIQGALEGMNLDDYWDMPPEERKARIIRNLVANTAFAAMEAPGIVGGGASATEGALGPKAKTALLVDALMKDPTAQEALRQSVDAAVFDALAGGRRAEAAPAVRPGVVVDFVADRNQPAPEIGPEEAGAGRGAINLQRVPARADGVFDVLDAIQELGGIAAPSQSKFADKGDYGGYAESFGNGLARFLRRSGGGLKPDELRDSLAANYGFKLDSTSDLYDAVDRAVKERGAGQSPEASAKAFYDAALENKGKAPRQRDSSSVPVDELKIGDVFEIKGERVRVTAIDPDTGDVTVNDGPKFGTKELPPNVQLFPDKGSFETKETPTEFVAAGPKLRQMEKQGDLLSGQAEDLTLTGERGTDFDRIAAERAAAERASAEAKAAQERQQEQFGALATAEKATLPRWIEGATEAPALDQPVSLAEIRQYLSKALDIPVRMGLNIRGGIRNALGYFRAKPETIRMKALNDIPTLAHEVGHYLHYILFPEGMRVGPNPPGALSASNIKASDFQKAYDSELLALGKRTSLKSYSQEKVRKEGVAEFFREWLTDRTQALAKAPGFASFFEQQLQSKFPEVWKIVSTAREQLGRYINQPALAKVMSMIAFKPASKSLDLKKWFWQQHAAWMNELGPIERSLGKLVSFGLPAKQAKMVNDYAVNYIGGWRGKVEHSLFARQIDFYGRDVGPSMRENLQGIEDLQEFDGYRVAKRALEKGGQGKETGIDVADARAVVDALAGKYEAKRLAMRQWDRNNLRLLVDAGTISEEQFQRMELMNQDFVPFHRVYETVGGSGGSGAKKGFINLSQGVGRFKGSDRQIVWPLESELKNAYLFRDLAEKNHVSQAFFDAVDSTRGGGRVADEMARAVKPVTVSHDEVVAALKAAGVDTEAMGADELDLTFKIWRAARNQSAKDGIVTFWRKGKEARYQVDDPDLIKALAMADRTDAGIWGSIPGRAVRSVARTLRAGATLTPEFIARNPFKDQVTAGVFSKYGFTPYWDGFRGVFHALLKDKWYYDWIASGGRYSDFVAMDRTDLQKTLEDVIKDRSTLQFAKDLAKPQNILQNLRKFSELMEQATRISEFRLAKQAGASDIEAANASKDVTINFARAGYYGRGVNQMIAFWNAGMQDASKTWRAHREQPFKTAWKAFKYITAPSLLAWILGKDDKEIQNLPEWRKQFYWNFNFRELAKVAGLADEGVQLVPYLGRKDWVFSFPKPFLLGQLYGTSVERGLDYINGRDPNAIRKWAKGVLQATPLSLDSIIPTIARPIVEDWANKSYYRNQPLESDAMKELPPAQRLTPQSSLTGRLIAEQLPWEWGVSPVKFDNTVRGYLGGLGKYGTDAADWLIAKVGIMNLPPTAEKTMWELPVLRGFVRTPYEASAYVQRFYDGLELAEQRVNAVKKMPLVMETSQAQRFIRSEKDDLAFYLAPVDGQPMITHLRNARKELGQVMKAMTMVQVAPGMSPQEKAQKLKELAGMRDRLAEAFFRTRVSPADQRRVF